MSSKFGKIKPLTMELAFVERQTIDVSTFSHLLLLAVYLALCTLFVHLSQRLIGELIGYPWSGVRRRPSSAISNISSKTAWPFKAKFHVEPPREGGTKVCINDPGHMTKMAAIPLYGKNL